MGFSLRDPFLKKGRRHQILELILFLKTWRTEGIEIDVYKKRCQGSLFESNSNRIDIQKAQYGKKLYVALEGLLFAKRSSTGEASGSNPEWPIRDLRG